MTAIPTGDMFGRIFPGEAYQLEFVPTAEQSAAVTRLAEDRDAVDLLPMLLSESAAADGYDHGLVSADAHSGGHGVEADDLCTERGQRHDDAADRVRGSGPAGSGSSDVSRLQGDEQQRDGVDRGDESGTIGGDHRLTVADQVRTQ